MKIAFIGQKGMPAIHGGVESHVHDLSLGLTQAGHEITVYARKWYTKSEDRIFDGVKIKHTPSLHTKHLDTISHTFFSSLHAIRNNFDIIHYHGIGPSLLSWLPRLFSRHSKVIVTFHSIDRYHQKWNFLAKLFLRLGEYTACLFPHETITVSQSLQKYCLNEFKKDTVYIPNGVNEKKLINQTDNCLNKFNLKKDNYLVMVSRLLPHKGAHVLVQAFNNLKKNNPDNNQIQTLKLAIVGGSTYTDNYIKKLHQLASINNQIIFTDFQSGLNLAELYKNSLALVHPSSNEGLPITVLQAMSYGKPVILSNIPEHLELDTDPKFIFRNNDILHFEEKLKQFILLNQAEKEKLGRENKNLIEKNYLWEKIVPQIEEVYENPQKQKTFIPKTA